MAAEVVGHKQKQAWIDKVLPPVEQVQPGLWSIPVAIPIKPLRYVLVYVMETPDGVALIDAGWNDDASYDTLAAGLKEAGHTTSDIHDIFVTHVHPDHFGLAKRLREETGARIALHRREAKTLMIDPKQEVQWQMEGEVRSVLHAIPEEDQRMMKQEVGNFRSFVDHSAPDILLDDGQQVELSGWTLSGILTPGHTPGHLCFAEPNRKILFTGDHVLPRITPNISVHSNNPTDSLARYLESLAKITETAESIDGVTGLPGHEYRYAGIADRARELMAHHEERLEELRNIVVEHPGISTWEISQRLTWSRDWSTFQFPERRSALGEAIAHAELLSQRGVITPGDGDKAEWRLTS